MSLSERPRVVIAGAGSGLGRSFCVELARRGARLLASDIDEAAAAEPGGRGAQARRSPGAAGCQCLIRQRYVQEGSNRSVIPPYPSTPAIRAEVSWRRSPSC